MRINQASAPREIRLEASPPLVDLERPRRRMHLGNPPSPQLAGLALPLLLPMVPIVSVLEQPTKLKPTQIVGLYGFLAHTTYDINSLWTTRATGCACESFWRVWPVHWSARSEHKYVRKPLWSKASDTNDSSPQSVWQLWSNEHELGHESSRCLWGSNDGESRPFWPEQYRHEQSIRRKANANQPQSIRRFGYL